MKKYFVKLPSDVRIVTVRPQTKYFKTEMKIEE